MKTQKEKLLAEVKKLQEKRDKSSQTFTKVRLASKIKKLKYKIDKL